MSSHPPEESGWIVVVILCGLLLAIITATILRVIGRY